MSGTELRSAARRRSRRTPSRNPRARRGAPGAARRTIGQEAQERLDAARAEAEQCLGRPVAATIVFGDPADEVLRHVASAASDLLVVGTHGRRLLTKVVLGSVAERLIRDSPCPVVVAHRAEALEQAEVVQEAAQYR